MKVTFTRPICACILYKTVRLLSTRTTSFTALCSYVKPTDVKKNCVHFINRRSPNGDGRLTNRFLPQHSHQNQLYLTRLFQKQKQQNNSRNNMISNAAFCIHGDLLPQKNSTVTTKLLKSRLISPVTQRNK